MDTRLESEGAEFLVLGLLLTEGIEAHKTYTRFPGYDIVVVDGSSGRSGRISVKSRWATNYDGAFPIKNWDFDFVVCVALNRGFSFGKKPKDDDDGRRPPQLYVLPRSVAERNAVERTWGQVVYARRLEPAEAYVDNWDQIRDFLNEPSRRRSSSAKKSQ